MTEFEHIHGLSQRGFAEWFETHISCDYCPMREKCAERLDMDCIDLWEMWLETEYDPNESDVLYNDKRGLERGFQKLCRKVTDHKYRECYAYADYSDEGMPIEYHYRCKVCGYRFWNYNKPTVKQTRDKVVKEHILND